jgi:hypothetical protein
VRNLHLERADAARLPVVVVSQHPGEFVRFGGGEERAAIGLGAWLVLVGGSPSSTIVFMAKG